MAAGSGGSSRRTGGPRGREDRALTPHGQAGEGGFGGGRPPHPSLKRTEPPQALREVWDVRLGGKAIFNFERHC